MAVDPLTRNLRDGTHKLYDGAGATLTLVLDEGDMGWTQAGVGTDTVNVLDRGRLSHTRPGDDVPIDLSFTAKWVQLIADTISGGSDGAQLYEMVENRHGTYSSTRSQGEQFHLRHVFEVQSPSQNGTTGERITFAYVCCKSLNCKEGADYNTIAFEGQDFETRPTIVRY